MEEGINDFLNRIFLTSGTLDVSLKSFIQRMVGLYTMCEAFLFSAEQRNEMNG